MRFHYAFAPDPGASGIPVRGGVLLHSALEEYPVEVRMVDGGSLPRAAVVQLVGIGVSRMGRLTVLDTRSGEVLAQRELADSPWCAAYSPDGSVLAIGTNLGNVLFFETERTTQQHAWRAHGPASYAYVYSLAWTPDGTRLLTVSGDETVKIWDTRTRVASRLDYERWQTLRAEMAARDDLAEAYASLAGEEREAARVEQIRRRTGRSR